MLNRVWQLLLVACLAVGTAAAAENPFIGTWKLNSAKSRTPDEMKVESKGGNTWTFDFGAGPETIVADGSDQPGVRGSLLSVKAEAPDTWIVERKLNGRLLLRATWKLAADGSTLTDYYREFAPDGSTVSLDYVYQRHGGGSGFAADWQSIRETRNTPLILEVKAYEGDGLTFSIPAQQNTRSAKLDGRDYPDEGPNASPGSSCSIQQVDGHTLKMTNKDGGKVSGTREIGLSPDGKTLTMTVSSPGGREPDVLVFDRE